MRGAQRGAHGVGLTSTEKWQNMLEEVHSTDGGPSCKFLRVSEPMGIQRSSYFISLPLRYGIPLYATSGLMHWLVSQSLFLARITAVDPEGQDDSKHSFSTCGYSPIATFISQSLSGIP